MEEKISSELKLADSRINSFRRSLNQFHDFASSFSLQWKGLEDHYASIHSEIQKRLEELHSIDDSIDKREEELNILRESAEERIREVEAREKEFELIQEKEIEGLRSEFELIEESRRGLRLVSDSVDEKARRVRATEIEVSEAWKEIEIREEQCALREEEIEERSRSVAVRDEELNRWAFDLKSRGKELEERREESALEVKKLEYKEKLIQDMRQEVELEKKKLMEQCEEVELKEKGILGRYEEVELEKKKSMERFLEVELKEKEIQGRYEEVELEKKKLNERFREVELKEKQLQGRNDEVVLEKKKLMKRDKEVELKEKRIQESYEEMELKKKKLNEQYEELEQEKENLMEFCREVKLQEKKIQERSQEVELEKKKLVERFEEVELKQKQLDERFSEFESSEKKPFDDIRKPFGVNYPKVHQEDANLHFVVSMDGKALQVFLNEHCAEYDSMTNDVFVALGLSSDPAKLVLDAIQGFYPPHLKNGDEEFEAEVIRKSCILLLEQLMKISPDIRDSVKREAMRLAFDWTTKLQTDAEHSLEVLGFLLLLASYGLAYAFDADELLMRLEIVALHSQAPELFRVLGFADKVSGFIRNLIGKKQQLEAIRFIHAFELISEFPPVPLLDGFLQDSRTAVKKLRKAARSLEEQIEASNKRIVDVSLALKCIEEFQIKYKISPKNLEQMIDSLEKENMKRKAETYLQGLKVKKLLRNKKKRLASTLEPMDLPVLTPVTSAATSHSLMPSTDNQRQLSRNKRPRIAELAEKNSNTCRGDADRGDLPLKSKDASASLDLQPKSNCFSVNTNKEDGKIAGDLVLKSKDASAWLDLQPKSNCISVSTKKEDEKASKDASASLDLQPKSNCFSVNTNKEDGKITSKDSSASLDLQPKSNCLSVNTNKEDGKITGELQFTCDPGKLVLQITNISFPSKLGGDRNFKLHFPKKCCNSLLEQLRNDSFQINPEIKEQAKEFALHWQSILEKNRDDPLEVNCFLQFLSAYKLASYFDAEKLLDLLLSLLDTDYWCKAAPDLCRDLGLTEKIPSFIQNYINRGQHIEAVKYIYALTIVDTFPPLPILKNHLINSSIAMQQGDIDSEINALKDVIKCISDFKITGLSPENLQMRIVQLEKQKEKLVIPKGVVKLENQNDEIPSTSIPSTHNSSVQTPNQHPQGSKTSLGDSQVNAPPKPDLGLHTSQGDPIPSTNPPPKHVSKQPPPQQPPCLPMTPTNPSLTGPLRQCTSVQPPPAFTSQGQVQSQGSHYSSIQPPPPPYPHPHSSIRSQPDPYMNRPPSHDSSMQPHLHNPYVNGPPRQDGSGQPPLPQQPYPYMSQGYPYTNAAAAGHYSSVQPTQQYHPGWYVNQGAGMAPNPHNQQLVWNGYCYVPAW